MTCYSAISLYLKSTNSTNLIFAVRGGVPHSHLDSTYNKVFLTSFTYQKSIHSRRNPNQTVEVTVNCYLRTEQEGWI